MATTETKPAAKDDAAPLLDVLEEDDEFEVRMARWRCRVVRMRRWKTGNPFAQAARIVGESICDMESITSCPTLR